MQPLSKRMRVLSAAAAIGLTLGIAGAAAAGATSPAGRSGAAAVAVTPKCATSGLVIWLDTTGQGTMGSTYYHLEFTNLSGHTCTISGYPPVSAVNLSGQQVGSAGSPDSTAKPGVISLANGARASTALRIVDVNNFSASSCQKATAAGLRVYPPGQTSSKLVPFPFSACSLTGPVFLHVLAVQAANTIG